jgi:DNA-binding beta-propeller fold protein YncE
MLLTCFRWFAVIPVGLLPSLAPAQHAPENDYLVYVLPESADRISLIRFGPKGASIERDLSTGSMPADIDGPHGIAISPDKKFYYVSMANGRPFGTPAALTPAIRANH